MNFLRTLSCIRAVWICILIPNVLSAQDFEPEYFPKALMFEDDVRIVTTYETRIDDPLGQAGLNNSIRLAKEVVEELFFDPQGNPTRKIYYDTGETIRDYLLIAYNEKGLCLEKSYHHRAPANFLNPDSNTVVLLETRTRFRYKGALCTAIVQENATGTDRDSTAIEYDLRGKKTRSVRQTPQGVVERRYTYQDNEVLISTWSQGKQLNHERVLLNAAGKPTLHEYYQGESLQPISMQVYNYHPRGWLEETRYEYPAHAGASDEMLITRQNFYDDHGKLLESSFDYGTGTRVIQMFDYSYYLDRD